MRKKLFLSCFVALAGLTACSNSDHDGRADDAEQVFEIAISSLNGKEARAGRPLYGSEASQKVDHVDLVFVNGSNQLLYVKTLDNWKDISTPYNNGTRYIVKLRGTEKLAPGHHTLYAYGYSKDGKKPTLPAVGGDLVKLSLDFSGNQVEEIFGEKKSINVDSETSRLELNSVDGSVDGSVTLLRQVAGAFGYFTNIPVSILDKPTTRVRLVASVKNITLEFDTNRELQVNGDDEAAKEDGVTFEDGTDAFEVYSANIADWFTDGDSNKDGFLGKGDTWINPKAGAGLNVLEGTMMAGEFMVPTYEHDTANTFELQLLDEKGTITKSWKVATPKVQDAETKHRYAIYRNHLYGIGEKTLDNPEDPESPGEGHTESPEDLSKDQDIILNISSDWEVIHKLELE